MSELWTKGEWLPDPVGAVYNESAGAYMIAIVQYPARGRFIPCFAFGETKEECIANGWLIASSKNLYGAVTKLLQVNPAGIKIAEEWMNWGDGVWEANNAVAKIAGKPNF